ncbi:UNVERIFIED_CONTAM: hypothetical protein NCL1_28645 [Trichonephila clavipes]
MMVHWIKTPYIVVGVGVGVGVIIYAVKTLRNQDNEDEINKKKSNKITRTLKIPKGFVGHVLGRKGATINSIRARSNTRITFDSSGFVAEDFSFSSILVVILCVSSYV